MFHILIIFWIRIWHAVDRVGTEGLVELGHWDCVRSAWDIEQKYQPKKVEGRRKNDQCWFSTTGSPPPSHLSSC